MPANPIVLVHGYSDEGASFRTWKDKLASKFQAEKREIHICNYISLNNEITIKDLAEGFDRTLRQCAGLEKDQPFDAVVHSTGMLVVCSWMATSEKRRNRLKRLVGLAPATFGSPLAHKGRSWLGAIFKGNKDLFSPDFLNAGDQILDGLELGSRFTWDLAHDDLFATDPVTGKTKTFYGPGADTPYVFIFCGNEEYQGFRELVNEPGTDGTVRWSSVSLDSRKITLDLRRSADVKTRLDFGDRQPLHTPLYPVEGVNHGTILTAPPDFLVDLVADGLGVSSEQAFNTWTAKAEAKTGAALKKLRRWQQFVVRAVDDRGDPITDYNLEVLYKNEGLLHFIKPEKRFPLDIHTYAADKSLRCFHINLENLAEVISLNDHQLKLRVIASSGTRLVTYSAHAIDDERQGDALAEAEKGNLQVELDMSPVLGPGKTFFYPFTTTLIELRLTREPTPLNYAMQCLIFNLVKPQ
jgi:hypothetical protein